jgi:hypothetical protein
MQQDRLAMSVARALTVANDAARERGTDPADALITISDESLPGGRVWRITYCHRDYINRRGGELIVLVDQATGQLERVLRGQ